MEKRSHFFFRQRTVVIRVGTLDSFLNKFRQTIPLVFRQLAVFILVDPLEHFRRVRAA
jgi:hypothetical protein